MSVDKFGRLSSTSAVVHPRNLDAIKLKMSENILLKYTKDGKNYDVEKHKLCNVQTPTDDSDCATKQYVDTSLLPLIRSIDTSNAVAPQIQVLQQQLTEENVTLTSLVKSLNKLISSVQNNKRVADENITQIKKDVQDGTIRLETLQQKISPKWENLLSNNSNQIQLLTQRINRLEQNLPPKRVKLKHGPSNN